MLLIPLDRKFDWRRPPLVTLGLLLVNVLVLVLVQGSEQARLDQALAYYADSGLMAMERQAWEADRALRGEPAEFDDPDDPGDVLFTLVDDPPFMERIRNGSLEFPNAADAGQWRLLRAEMDQRLDQVVFWRWGLRPADFNPLTLFSHMFLHGGVDHLLGNMLFLLLVGFLVEMTIGGPLFLATYLLGGILAGAADLLVAGDRHTPGVGASGAIAAMMGLYSVLFGRLRVRFFYSVGIWFDYVRAPAIIMLPLWLGWELLSWVLFTGSNINYAAHAAGLTVGALSGIAISRWLPGRINQAFLDAPEREATEQAERQTADGLLKQLDFDAARPVVQRLLDRHPDAPDLLEALHQCDRMHPASPQYHATVARILGQKGDRGGMDELVLKVYRDYRTRAKPRPRLSGRQIQALALRFCRQDRLPEAEQLLAVILPRHSGFPGTASLLVSLAEGHARAGHPERAQPHLERLLQLFPGTSEAELGRNLLRRLHNR